MLGLYPTWFEPGVGSGWVIALIATIHVLFSHASVGSALLFACPARGDAQPTGVLHVHSPLRALFADLQLCARFGHGPGHLVLGHDRQPARPLGADPQLRVALGDRMGVLPD
jgi:hypothetical protein